MRIFFTIGLAFMMTGFFLNAQEIAIQEFDYARHLFLIKQAAGLDEVKMEWVARPARTVLSDKTQAPESEAEIIFEVDLPSYNRRQQLAQKLPSTAQQKPINTIGWTATDSADFFRHSNVYFRIKASDSARSSWHIWTPDDLASPKIPIPGESIVIDRLQSSDQDTLIATLQVLPRVALRDSLTVIKSLERILENGNDTARIFAVRACNRMGIIGLKKKIASLIDNGENFWLVLEALQYSWRYQQKLMEDVMYQYLGRQQLGFNYRDAAMIELAGITQQEDLIPFIFSRFEGYSSISEAYDYNYVITDALKLMDNQTIADLIPLLLQKNESWVRTDTLAIKPKYGQLLEVAVFYKVDAAIPVLEQLAEKGDSTLLIAPLQEMYESLKTGGPADEFYVRRLVEYFPDLVRKSEDKISGIAFLLLLELYKEDEKELKKWKRYGSTKDHLKDLITNK